MTDEEHYEKFKKQAEEHTNAVVQSHSAKKLIIAGPGTGKSTLFKKICEDNIKHGKVNNIVLSFINELVDDLRKSLFTIAEVSTLHSFALKELQKTSAKGQGFYIRLTDVIGKDYEILNKEKVNFAEILCNLVENKEKLEFYKNRRQYYSFFGPNCSIYTLIKYFEIEEIIPTFDQLLVDEFQDFNKLEIKLIDLLSKKSDLLVAGDDDQSLYSFRFAYPTEIRRRHKLKDHEKFNLPFCFRCPNAVVDAFNNIVDKAKDQNFLKQRIDNRYDYFPAKEKDEVSNKNPKIVVRESVFDNNTAFYIEKYIKEIFESGDTNFNVLIITPLANQAIKIKSQLTKKRFRNVQTTYNKDDGTDKLIVDGLGLLLENSDCNLGWRLIAESLLNKIRFEKALKESCHNGINFRESLNEKEVQLIQSLLATIGKIKNKKPVAEKKYKELFELIKLNPDIIAAEKFLNEFEKYTTQKTLYKNTPIKITNILGAKGLTRDYVFLVNFDDKYLLDKGGIIKDEMICGFLVALTRARKRVYIFSQKKPTFAKWIDDKYIETA